MKFRRNFMNSYRIQDFMNRITIFLPMSVSPNGKKLAYISNVTSIPQVWLGEIDTKAKNAIISKANYN